MDDQRRQTRGIKQRRGAGRALALVVALSGAVQPAAALTRVRDIARPLGERTNKLIGYGIVVGLKGTGDSADSQVAVRPLREMLEKLGNPVEMAELGKTKNMANVLVTAELGRHGVRQGEKINVQVHSLYDAKSLAGGTLILTPLRGAHYADDRLYAWAQGAITLVDPAVPTTGVVKGGADMEEDVLYLYVDYESFRGKAVFTLVLEDDQASWQTAKAIADNINEEAQAPETGAGAGGVQAAAPAAVALGPKVVRVFLPDKQAENPAPFIARILNLAVPLPEPEAVVVINERTGVIAMTGNVEIAPVIVTVNGLSIRVVEPAPQPQAGQALVTQTTWSHFDTTGQPGAKLQQLITAMDQLNVPVRDKINAIYEISRAGALRAALRTEN